MVTRAQDALKWASRSFVAGLLLSMHCLSFGQAGAILVSSGNNHLDRGQTVVAPLKPGTAVRSGDAIVTAPSGRLQVRFADGALVSMQPSTRFKVDEHRFNRDESRSFFSLIRGAIRVASGLIGKRNHDEFKLSTPTATVGIRGTHFVVEHTVCDPRCWPGEQAGTRVSVTDGRVIISNQRGKIELRENESALINDEDSLPVKIAWAPQLTPRGLQMPQSSPPLPEADGRPGANTGMSPGDPQEARHSLDEPGLGRERFSRWVDDPPSADADRRKADKPKRRAPRAQFNFDRPVDLPNGADSRKRNGDGEFPELVARFPDQRGDETGGEEPPLDEVTEPGPSVPRVEEPNPNPTPNPDPDPLPPAQTPAGPGPRAGTTETTNWLVSLQPLPGLAQAGLISSARNLLTFDSNIGLQAIGRCDGGLCLSRGTAVAAEAGHDDYAAWGRWTDGNLEVVVFGLRTPIAVGPNQGLHYITGAPAVSLPANGSFTYTLTAATAPTMSHDWYSPGQFTGQAGVQFAPGTAPRVGLTGQVNLADEQFQFSTQGGAENPAASQLTLDNNQQFSGDLVGSGGSGALSWMCGAQGCPTRVRGALFGPSGERLGLSYTIRSESGSTTIDGVGIFSRP